MSGRPAFTPEATIGPFYPGDFLTHTPQDLYTVASLVAHRPAGQSLVVAVRFLDELKRDPGVQLFDVPFGTGVTLLRKIGGASSEPLLEGLEARPLTG